MGRRGVARQCWVWDGVVVHIREGTSAHLFEMNKRWENRRKCGRDVRKVRYNRYQKTQMAWVKSRLVLTAALRDPGVKKSRMIREQEDPVRWLQEKLDVSF